MTQWAYFISRFRWIILLFGIFLMLAAGKWGSAIMNQLGSGGYSDPHSEAARVDRIVKEKFNLQSPDVVVVYTVPKEKSIDSIRGAVEKSLSALDPQLFTRPAITYWNTPHGSKFLLSKDHKKALAILFISGDENQRIAAFNKIEPYLKIPEVATSITGFNALANTINNQSKSDLTFAESLSIPITLIFLILIFGGIVAASLPLLIGILSTLGSIAALRLISEFYEVNVFAINISSLLSLGLAIDYGLFIVSRFREELEKVESIEKALTNTLNSAGRTIGFSALLLICAFSGTLVFPQATLRSLGFGAMSAVAMAAALSLTVLPAILSILEHRISKWSWRKDAFSRGEKRAQKFWKKTTKIALNNSGIIAATIFAFLVLLALPISGIKLNDVDLTALPADSPARLSAEFVSKEFPETSSGLIVLLHAENENTISSDAIERVTSRIYQVPAVRSVQLAENRNGYAVLRTQLSVPDRSQIAMNSVTSVRSIVVPDGLILEVGGINAITTDSVSTITEKLPIMIGIMALATFVLMLLAFGSIVLPLKAIFVAFLSLAATFGILTFIFYDGHFAELLAVSQGPLAAGMVVLVISVIFGLSTDYEVFLISRIVEAKNSGATTDEAILEGVTKTGRVVTAAAILLILVTGAFALSSLTPMRFIGIGMIIALVIDATLVRMLLVPTLIKLMGKANWYGPTLLQKNFSKDS